MDLELDYLIKLTLGLYQVTELFPEEEPLKNQTREKANEILADLILIKENPVRINIREKKPFFEGLMKKIEILKSYFKIAQAQNWADIRNFLVLEREYSKIKGKIEQYSNQPQNIQDMCITFGGRTSKSYAQFGDPISKHSSKLASKSISKSRGQKSKKTSISERQSISGRQKRILGILKDNGKIQTRQMKEIFPEKSKRTLQRDLEKLILKNLIEKKGERNDTFYQLKV